MQEALTARNIPDLAKGAAEVIINKAIDAAVFDLYDRGVEDKARRKVKITLTLGLLDNGDMGTYVEAEAVLPKRRTKSTIGMVKFEMGEPQMHFQTLDEEDPRQRTIDERLADQKEAEAKRATDE